ncbi:hypothetical protein DQE80_15225, partial [Enterococcus sp. HPCN18]
SQPVEQRIRRVVDPPLAVDRYAAGQPRRVDVRMAGVHAAVDDCDADAASGGGRHMAEARSGCVTSARPSAMRTIMSARAASDGLCVMTISVT